MGLFWVDQVIIRLEWLTLQEKCRCRCVCTKKIYIYIHNGCTLLTVMLSVGPTDITHTFVFTTPDICENNIEHFILIINFIEFSDLSCFVDLTGLDFPSKTSLGSTYGGRILDLAYYHPISAWCIGIEAFARQIPFVQVSQNFLSCQPQPIANRLTNWKYSTPYIPKRFQADRKKKISMELCDESGYCSATPWERAGLWQTFIEQKHGRGGGELFFSYLLIICPAFSTMKNAEKSRLQKSWDWLPHRLGIEYKMISWGRPSHPFDLFIGLLRKGLVSQQLVISCNFLIRPYLLA